MFKRIVNISKLNTFNSLKSKQLHLLTNEENLKVVNFECDLADALATKSTWELWRALLILRACSVDTFVDNSLQLMKMAEKVLGPLLFEKIMKQTIYAQFVAGDDEQSISQSIRKLRHSNIMPMVACMMESDSENLANVYEFNYFSILSCLHILNKADNSGGSSLQIKMTGIMPCHLVTKLGNTNGLDGDLHDTNTKKEGVFTSRLTETETEDLKIGIKRLKKLAQTARDLNIRLLIDGEFVTMNQGISNLGLALMSEFNQEQPVVGLTYQCYLKKTYDILINDLHYMDKMGIKNRCFKIVRGAYMEQERQMAAGAQKVDPVNEHVEQTADMYNKVVNKVLDLVSNYPEKNEVFICTHNTKAIENSIKKAQQLGIQKRGSVHFGQLMGIGDHISYKLAQHGYSVYKSIPYGTVGQVLPYLYRRATENRAMLKGAKLEYRIIKTELKRRLTKF